MSERSEQGSLGEDLVRSLEGSSAIGLLLIDAGGKVRGWNRKALDLIGWPDEGLRGRPSEEIFSYLPFPQARDPHSDEARNRAVEVLARRKDGASCRLHVAIGDAAEDGSFAVIVLDPVKCRTGKDGAAGYLEALVRGLEKLPLFAFHQDLDFVYRWYYAPYLGLHPEQVIGRRDEEFFPPEEASRLLELKRSVLAGGLPVRRGLWLTVFGRPAYFDFEIEPLIVPSGEVLGIACVGLEVTAQRLAEEALQASERQFRTLADFAPVGIFLMDPAGKCLFVNRRWCDLAGMKAEEALGDGWVQALIPEDRVHVEEWYRAAAEGSDFRREGRFLPKGGKAVWLEFTTKVLRDDAGSVAGHIGVVVDLSDRKLKEELQATYSRDLTRQVAERTERLSAANDRLREEIAVRERAERSALESGRRVEAILDAIPDHVVRLDRKGKVLEIRPGKEFPLLRPPAQMVGKTIGQLYSPDLGREAEILIARALETGLVQSGVYENNVMGRMLYVDVRVLALGSDEVLAIVRNVTERVTSEEKARRLQDELAHVARIATVGELSSGLAHQINQPLAAIANYSSAGIRLLRSGTEDRAALLEAFTGVQEQAERASQVIVHLRNFIARRTPQMTPVVLRELIEDSLRLCEGDLRKGDVRLEMDLDPSIPSLVLDSIGIQQVLLNLLGNAIEAMRAISGERRIRIESRRSGDMELEVSVSDTGPGIPSEIAAHLFEPFLTTKPGGLGMGLVISRSIVETYGGRIEMRRNAEKGTTFFFTLPIGGDDAR